MIKIKKGQLAVEYLLLFATVALVIFLALGPNGFMTKRIGQTLNASVDMVNGMVRNITFNAD